MKTPQQKQPKKLENSIKAIKKKVKTRKASNHDHIYLIPTNFHGQSPTRPDNSNCSLAPTYRQTDNRLADLNDLCTLNDVYLVLLRVVVSDTPCMPQCYSIILFLV